ncbi:hypothetical protein [Saccharopolyspora spinosa]|uniref:Uncharacterized protein n=1 Tax=Saccharopolyspora spinosa TaxID=60894 RepID=A0A2N3Y6I7_SACSN|nr:hypothetical protein [Saccharopolyspora spinosa]PKW18547.1 hypothetical protein A8926_6642 [Saccharopolyspora spinosa]
MLHAPDTPMVLIDAWKPSLDAGRYTVEVGHEVNDNDGTQQKFDSDVREVDVQAPRFTLDQRLLHTAFPVAGTSGDLARVLPHVCLSGPTLPWQRTADPPEEKSGTPWLALILLRHNELIPDSLTRDEISNRPVAEFFPADPSAVADGLLLPALTSEQVLVGPDTCRTIDLTAATFTAVVPRLAEIHRLVHVRRADEHAPEPGPEDVAVVIANRLPRSGAYSAHLVSLEGHGTWLTTLPNTGTNGKGPVKTVRLVSLHSWHFTTDTGNRPSFLTVAKRVVHNSGAIPLLRLPFQPTVTDGTARVGWRLEHGYVPLRHHLPTGERTHAWYRGPFTPVPPGSPPEQGTPPTSEAEAMIYEPADAVFDVSYAAAFALGKVLGLVHPAVSPALAGLRADAAHLLAHIASGHAGRDAEAWAGQNAERMAADVASGRWSRRAFEAMILRDEETSGSGIAPEERFATAMTAVTTPDSGGHRVLGHLVDTVIDACDELKPVELLARVPFTHLVPEHRMLPGETVRFFHIDPHWVAALVAGAADVGGHTELDTHVTHRLRDQLLTGADLPVAGMLVRSALVRDWPGLIVDARDSSGSVLREVRVLAPDLLLAYFNAVPDAVTLRQPPQAPHFGLDGDWYLQLRYLVGDDIGGSMGDDDQLAGIDGMLRRSGDFPVEVFDIESFVEQLKTSLVDRGQWESDADLAPAAVALQLVDTPGELVFSPPHAHGSEDLS